MDKTRVFFWGIAMAVIGAIIPISLMGWLSWQSALRAEHERLAVFSEKVIERTNLTINEAKRTLQIFTPLTFTPCSKEHIAKMRQMTVNTSAIEEIGYFEHRVLKCTSWGQTESHINQVKSDYITADGTEISYLMRPNVSGADPMMAIQFGAYNALINPARFADILAEHTVHLVLKPVRGPVIAESGAAIRETLVDEILANPASNETEDYYHAQMVKDGWIAIAITDKEQVQAEVRAKQLWMLPLGTFISVFIVLLIVRQSRQRMSPRAELQLAVKKKEFIVHYQPIIDLNTGHCVGAEALVRWRRPDGKIVRPDLFIPLAEDTGLILPITDQVIQTVIAELKDMLAANRALHVAINLSADDVKTGRVLDVIASELHGTNVLPEQIWLEATERGFMDITSARTTLGKARAMGYWAALDDFGTGYSSLQYVQGLPVNALKIDKSFINTIGTGAVSGSVIGHIINMAKSLNLLIVAEGVEKADQIDYLKDKGVDFVQGWFYAKAMPVDDFIDFYQDNLNVFGAAPDITQKQRELQDTRAGKT
jgi:sensor c-di-GMP phosphodiesterase-like protein